MTADDNKLPIPAECQELNDGVLLCHDEHKDWRKCQELVKKFRDCIIRDIKRGSTFYFTFLCFTIFVGLAAVAVSRIRG